MMVEEHTIEQQVAETPGPRAKNAPFGVFEGAGAVAGALLSGIAMQELYSTFNQDGGLFDMLGDFLADKVDLQKIYSYLPKFLTSEVGEELVLNKEMAYTTATALPGAGLGAYAGNRIHKGRQDDERNSFVSGAFAIGGALVGSLVAAVGAVSQSALLGPINDVVGDLAVALEPYLSPIIGNNLTKDTLLAGLAGMLGGSVGVYGGIQAHDGLFETEKDTKHPFRAALFSTVSALAGSLFALTAGIAAINVVDAVGPAGGIEGIKETLGAITGLGVAAVWIKATFFGTRLNDYLEAREERIQAEHAVTADAIPTEVGAILSEPRSEAQGATTVPDVKSSLAKGALLSAGTILSLTEEDVPYGGSVVTAEKKASSAAKELKAKIKDTIFLDKPREGEEDFLYFTRAEMNKLLDNLRTTSKTQAPDLPANLLLI